MSDRPLSHSAIAVAAAALCTCQAHAAEVLDASKHAPQGQGIQGLFPQARAAAASSGVLTTSGVVAVAQVKGAQGAGSVRYQQHHLGVPIWGMHITENTDRDSAQTLSGRFVRGIEGDLPNVQPALSAQQAIGRVEQVSKVHNAEAAQAKLYVFINERGVAELVYHVAYTQASRPGVAVNALVNAQDGSVRKLWNGVVHAQSAAPAKAPVSTPPKNVGTAPAKASGDGGNPNTGKFSYGSGDKAALSVTNANGTCTLDNAETQTIDVGVNATQPVSFPCSVGHLGRAVNGGYSPANDAHAYASYIIQMYRDWLGQHPLNGKKILNRTSAPQSGGTGANAYFDGNQTMNYGDGDNHTYPWVNLEIASHEISHGYTEYHSRLAYEKQSGGMNEAYSDMAGVAATAFAGRKVDYQIGKDINKSAAAAPLRTMDAQDKDGHSITHAKLYWEGLDVHYSSGVYNKAFTLLAKKPGWSVRKAFEVMADANATQWQRDAHFNSGACGVRTAAQLRGYSTTDVESAFAAVGVKCDTEGVYRLSNPDALTLPSLPVYTRTDDFGQQTTTHAQANYRIDVPAGVKTLVVMSKGSNGDIDLFLKRGGVASPTVFDQKSDGGDSNETITIKNPAPGAYYLAVHAYKSSSNVTVSTSMK